MILEWTIFLGKRVFSEQLQTQSVLTVVRGVLYFLLFETDKRRSDNNLCLFQY